MQTCHPSRTVSGKKLGVGLTIAVLSTPRRVGASRPEAGERGKDLAIWQRRSHTPDVSRKPKPKSQTDTLLRYYANYLSAAAHSQSPAQPVVLAACGSGSLSGPLHVIAQGTPSCPGTATRPHLTGSGTPLLRAALRPHRRRRQCETPAHRRPSASIQLSHPGPAAIPGKHRARKGARGEKRALAASTAHLADSLRRRTRLLDKGAAHQARGPFKANNALSQPLATRRRRLAALRLFRDLSGRARRPKI